MIFLIFSDNHFTQHVHFPSRLQNYLDLVFSNRDVIRNVAPSTPLSDHLSVIFDLCIPLPPPKQHVTSRLYKFADWVSINSFIFNHDWTLAFSRLDVQQSYEYFVSFINDLLDTFVPLSKPSSFSRYPKSLKILYSKSRNLSRIAPNSYASYKMTDRFNSALNRFHCTLENRIVNSSNPKLFYSYCNSKLNAPKITPSGIVDSDGSLLLSNNLKCIAFDRFFCSVFTHTQSSPLPQPSPSLTFDIPSVSELDIIYALSKFSPKINVTPDHIPSIVLSKCRSSIISPLLIIFNKSLLTSQVPSLCNCIIKDLGVQFSPSLSFSAHISKIIASARSKCSLPPVPYRTRLRDLNLYTLERRRFIMDVTFLQSVVNNRYSMDASSLLTCTPLPRTLRNCHNLRISLPFIPHNSFSTLASRTILIWNSLPPEIVNSSQNAFRYYIRSQPPSFYPDSIICNWLDL
ncbi:hypothetical protein PENTCL1PPCAC_11070, partial [Pristionchus entomophagus]